MKQVEIKLNISAVAPLLDVIKQAADDLRDTLAIAATFPEEDADFTETWTQELMAAQNSDVRELLGLFDSDFFTEGSISIDSNNCESLLRGCAAVRIRIWRGGCRKCRQRSSRTRMRRWRRSRRSCGCRSPPTPSSIRSRRSSWST